MIPFVEVYGTTVTEQDTPALTTTFISLTASIIYVGELVGAIISAPVNEKWGRKAVFFCASICIIIGAIVQAADQGSMAVIVIGRTFIGLGIGQFTVTCLLYIGEVAPQRIRGPALMMFQFMQSCSQLLGSGITQATSTITSTASFRVPMALLTVYPVVMLLGLLLIPESPLWCMRKDRPFQAQLALKSLNRSDSAYEATTDLSHLEAVVHTERIQSADSSWRSLFSDPIERRKLLYSCGAMVAQQINGIQFFYSYGVVFAQSIGISQPFLIQVITNVLQVISVGISVALGNKVPRRPNLLFTTILMLVSFIAIGGLGTTNIHNSTTGFKSSISTTIVVVSYIVICAFNFGHGPLAFTIASETAVGRNRNKILACSIVSFFLTVFVIAFTSPYLYYSARLGPMLGFVYAGTTCITLAYVWFCVGETVGRSHREIELFFQHRIPVRQWASHRFDDTE